jgi:peptidoglycan/xylan/chitin deacetylase (PgdA/CDA1 family)
MLRAFRRGDLRSSLLIVMFHRVVDAVSPEFSSADPAYSVSTDLFDALLGFFNRHHSVVGLNDVFDAAMGRRALPEFPLLITFDDGWRDNLTCAAPILARHGLPAVIFLALDAVRSPEPLWWQERVFFAHRTGSLSSAVETVRSKLPPGAAEALAGRGDILDFVSRAAALGESERELLLRELPILEAPARMMLRAGDLSQLACQGISFGVHGISHLPLTKVADLTAELSSARAELLALTGDEGGARALALPHGRFDQRVLDAARACDYRLVFSSEPVLNPLTDGFIDAERPLGRINVGQEGLVDVYGRPDLGAVAAWLWLRRTGQRSLARGLA